MSTVDFAVQFAARGYRSFCICPRGSFIERVLNEKHPDVLVCSVDVRRRYLDWRTSKKISNFLKEHSISSVVLHSLRDIWIVYPGLLGLPDVRLTGICRMFVRNVNKKDFLHRVLYRRFQSIVTLGRSQQKELLNCVPLREEICSTIPNGVDIERFRPGLKNGELRKTWGAADNQLVLGYVGRLDPQKGLSELISALKLISEEQRPKLIIVGSETAVETGYRLELINMIERLELKDWVNLEPETQDVPTVLGSFDIFVLPSYEEAFGRVLIEAMSCGIPSISTNRGGPAEILDGGEFGLLVEPKSPQELADAIAALCGNSNLRRSFGELGRKIASERYDRKQIFPKYEKIILGERPGREL